MHAGVRWAWRALFLLVAVGAAVPVYLIATGSLGGEGRAAAAVEISRPPGEVFPYLVRDELLAKWLGGLLESRPLTPGAPGVGSKWIEKVGNPESPHELEVEIAAYEQDRALALKVVHPEFTTEARYDLRDRGGRTLVIYQASSRYTHPVSRLLAPVISRLDQDKLEGDLARLKFAVEGPPVPWADADAGTTAAMDTGTDSDSDADAGAALDPVVPPDEPDAGVAEALPAADAGEPPPPTADPPDAGAPPDPPPPAAGAESVPPDAG